MLNNNKASLIFGVSLLVATLSGCGSDGTTEYVYLSGGAGSGEPASGGSSAPTATAPLSATAGGSGGASATSAPAELAQTCTPGASVACACADGATSAQVCATDGRSYGECDCGPEPVAEVVAPEGYSGECVGLGLTDACFVDGIRRYAFVNCAKSPDAEMCISSVPVMPGGYCCPRAAY